MSALFTVAAIAKAGFYRCAKFFPHEGLTLAASEFTEKQWERIRNEPQLRVTEATEKDVEAAEARALQIVEIIKSLEPADFGSNDKPKVDAINALLDANQPKVKSGERDEIWAKLLEADGKENTNDE